MNSEDKEVRSVILTLVQELHRCRKAVMAERMALEGFSSISPAARGNLTAAQIRLERENIRNQFATQSDPRFVAMERMLMGADEYSAELREFLLALPRWQ